MRKHVLSLLTALLVMTVSFTAVLAEDEVFNPLYDETEDVIEIYDTTPVDPVIDEPVTQQQLLQGEEIDALIANRHFAPGEDSEPATMDFVGTLQFDNAVLGFSEVFTLGKGPLHGKDTTVFPDVAIDFVTVDDYLVPVTQHVIANGTLSEGESYWDIIVQPGRVWQEQNNKDEGWQRAAFPFAFVNRLEGESHNGLALFLYNESEVSHVRVQVVAQTRPGEVPDYFNAWGTVPATYIADAIDDPKAVQQRFRAELADRIPTAPLSDLEGRVDAETLAAFDGATTAKEEQSVLQTGLYYNGVLYMSDFATAAGPYPYPEEARFGVWSVTKSAILNVAFLRLAEKYSEDVVDKKLVDYIPQAADVDGWEDVTFMDMANMASGRGATEDDPTCYLCDYQRWNLAPSKEEKIKEALDYILVWEPGTKTVYRDQDSFLFGAAMENFLQHHEGPEATLVDMIMEEVFQPIGIYHIAANHTIEAGDADGQIKAEFGYYPTFDEMTKIALLYQNHGEWNGKQILNRSLVGSLLPGEEPPAMALVKEEEEVTEHGALHYAMNWHIEPYAVADECVLHLPSMSGFGGNLVTLLPGDMVSLRVANATSDFNSPAAQADAAAQLTSFCMR